MSSTLKTAFFKGTLVITHWFRLYVYFFMYNNNTNCSRDSYDQYYPQLITSGRGRGDILESSRWSSGAQSVSKMLCLKLLPQFSSHLNETCYTWFIWSIDVYDEILIYPYFLWSIDVYDEILIYPYFLWQSVVRRLYSWLSVITLVL